VIRRNENRETRTMNRTAVLASLATTACLVFGALPAAAAAAPALELTSNPSPSKFLIGQSTNGIDLILKNTGDATIADDTVTIVSTLPPELTATGASSGPVGFHSWNCVIGGAGHTVTCTGPSFFGLGLAAGEQASVRIKVAVAPGVAEGTVVQHQVQACGGGAPICSSDTDSILIQEKKLRLTDSLTGAYPGPTAWFAGTCDLSQPDVTAFGGSGDTPASPAHCIDPGTVAVGSAPTPPSPWEVPPAWRLAPVTAAASHPDGTASFFFDVNRDASTSSFDVPTGAAQNVKVDFPPGVVANPQALPTCSQEDFEKSPNQCQPEAQIGLTTIRLATQPSIGDVMITRTYPIYNLEPRKRITAEFGIPDVAVNNTQGTSVRIVGKAQTDDDFRVTGGVMSIPTQFPLIGQQITLWGVPWAASHDPFRSNDGGGTGDTDVLAPGRRAPYHSSWGPIRPFFSIDTECEAAPVTTVAMDSYEAPGRWLNPDVANPLDRLPDLSDPNWLVAGSESPPVDGCADVPFDPSISLEPSTHGADSPAGLDVDLTIPQNNEPPAPVAENPSDSAGAPAHWKGVPGRATAHLKDTAVTLPEGFTLNPAAADGQGVCTTAQIGLKGTNFPSPTPIRFDNDDPSDGVGHDCPDASKIGTVTVRTPLLAAADSPTGEVYLAAQGDNPFGSDFAIYIAVRSPERNLVVKLAGKVTPDPATGRLTTTVTDNPQLPFEDFELNFRGGPRAPLATPSTCGTHLSVSSFTPWSAAHGAGGLTDTVDDPFAISSSPTGGCAATKAALPLLPGFAAGSGNPVAGAHSPFTVRLTRPDGNQELDRIEVTTPEGFAAKLAGVPYCSEAAIARAIARTATGDGAKEQIDPSCPAASQVGTTTIGAGAGSNPFYVSGKAYFAGPYKGAPVSLAFVVPAVAGPFDLGVQVVRAALNVNPKTAQITTVSDAIPQILRGVPLRIRDIRVSIDRSNFTINPTDCSEMAVSARVFGASGAVSNVSNRFQLDGCANLGFRPNLKLQLFGPTKRAAYPRLKATLTAREGDANISRAAVTLPHSAFLAQEHIVTVCTRVQFAADACPRGSIYGQATAISPLLDAPLSGPVYLRSNGGERLLPDLVAALKGPDNQPIEIELEGHTDSRNGGIRNTFEIVPDAPVSKFTLELKGGNKSLIRNSVNLCKHVNKATVRFDAQNGRERDFRTRVLSPACGKSGKASAKHGRR
jgi:hypothetical protein